MTHCDEELLHAFLECQQCIGALVFTQVVREIARPGKFSLAIFCEYTYNGVNFEPLEGPIPRTNHSFTGFTRLLSMCKGAVVHSRANAVNKELG
jgi:hypothetical protein